LVTGPFALRAAALWDDHDLFGIQPTRPEHGLQGLIWQVRGGQIAELDGGGATILYGGRSRFCARHRFHHANVVLPWEMPV
jgi:hypothetical protein